MDYHLKFGFDVKICNIDDHTQTCTHAHAHTHTHTHTHIHTPQEGMKRFRAIFLSEMKGKVTQSCPTLRDPMDSPGQTLEWVAFPFSRGSSQPRDRAQVSHIAGRFSTS